MKEEFKRRFCTMKLEWDTLSEEEQALAKKLEAVNIRTTLAQEFWKLESDAPRADITKDAEDEYQRDLEEWKALQTAPTTPQQFHQ